MDSPTISMAATEAGVILGTAAYMAPEQARGKIVDKRADIWAFGVVLYEMITGRPPFLGEDVSHTLASVILKEPDLDAIPPRIRRVLKRCLRKDPNERLRDISGIELLLEEQPAESTPQPGVRWRWIIATALIGAVALGAGAVAFRHMREEPPRVMKLSLSTPERANFNIRGSIPQISPDGRHVVFAPPIDGKSDLWVRDLDDLQVRLLPGTSGATYPFWSPDSRWVGFFTNDKLKKIDVTGGPPLTICDVAGGRGGTWNQYGTIVYGSYQNGLLRVPAAGGTPVVLHAGGLGHVERHPWFLPDGRHFLYTYTNGGVYEDSIDARPGVSTAKQLLADDTNAVFEPPLGSSPGYLLFLRERTLMAQPFDAAKIQTTGDPMPVAENVAFVSPPAGGQFSVSRTGTLVYAPEALRNKQLTWFDRNGKAVGTLGMPADTLSVAISPDGLFIAADTLNAEGNGRDVSLYDVTRVRFRG